MVTWGGGGRGGDSSAVAAELNGSIDATQICSTISAFAALRSDGSVVTWGDSSVGGDSSAVTSKLNSITQIYSTHNAFAALRTDGSVVTWGDSSRGGDSSAVASQLDGTTDVIQIYPSGSAFAALRNDGSVVTWGHNYGGGDSSAVATELNKGVTQIYSTPNAFAALRNDGSVVTWGDGGGGDSSAVATQLNGTTDISQIYSTANAFAALRTDGSVITWGNSTFGSDSSAVVSQLTSGVVSGANIYTNDVFTAINNNSPTGAVSINDSTPEQKQVLTVSNTLADADGLGVVTYSWLVNDQATAVGDSYTTTVEDIGKTIKVIASYTDGLGNAESVHSADTSAVTAPVNHAPIGNVTINNTAPQQGQTLTASNDLTDADGLGVISYLWQANGVNLATGNSYTLTDNEIGKIITATAKYTDLLGTAESVSSTATAPVTNSPVSLTAGVNIIGTDFITSEQGDTAIFSVKLNSAPNRDVTIDFASSDTSEGIVTNPTLKFTSANWSIAQTFTVKGQSDSLVDGNIAYSINAKVTTLDIFYKSVATSSLTLTNQDTPVAKVENITGTNSMDTLRGTSAPSYILGEAADDDLSGGAGNDTVYGSYGSDLLFGEDGNDVLYGEQDADYLDGGAGNDILDGGLGLDTLIGGAGNDTYYLGYDAADVIDDQGLASDVDVVIMPYQLSKYTLPKGIEQGTIAAGTGASSLTGNTGNNTLTGNDGSNMLNGAVGRDSLFGGAGNDVLLGGTGNDTLSGGAGKDTFKFNAALTANIDKITDFSVADDTIQLENSFFTKLSATGVLAAGMFVKGAAAQDANDYVVYNAVTGAVTYDADGSGTGAGLQIAVLGINLALTNADFVVI